MILLIDNYDSTAHNLYQLVGEINHDVRIVRNDAIGLGDVQRIAPSHIVLSPGPCRLQNTGICADIIAHMTNSALMCLGVGAQLFYEAYGGETRPAVHPKQGQSLPMALDTACPLFSGLPKEMQVGRYDAVSLSKKALPSALSVIAEAEGEIMGVRHHSLLHFGILFHPESILTPNGKDIMARFLS